MVSVLAERVRQLRHLDDVQGGPMMVDWIEQDLHWAASLASTAAHDQETGAALFGVLAELAQLAGWVATDLGQRALGQRYLLSALRFAHIAADTELAAAIVSCLSYRALWRGVVPGGDRRRDPAVAGVEAAAGRVPRRGHGGAHREETRHRRICARRRAVR